MVYPGKTAILVRVTGSEEKRVMLVQNGDDFGLVIDDRMKTVSKTYHQLQNLTSFFDEESGIVFNIKTLSIPEETLIKNIDMFIDIFPDRKSVIITDGYKAMMYSKDKEDFLICIETDLNRDALSPSAKFVLENKM